MGKRAPQIDPKESLLAAIEALPASRVNGRTDAVKVTTDFLTGGYGIIVEAAAMRRLSLSAFVRRAAYAMACHDLGMPLSDAIERDPRMSRENGFPVRDAEGTAFGNWEIEKVVGDE